mmetsp:Transcript_33045/g.60940  ORF Transcript_33045/g.60940 Transcript_33045/m.60940 type:complete len:301 (+) Transcript_33045:2-904(+)
MPLFGALEEFVAASKGDKEGGGDEGKDKKEKKEKKSDKEDKKDKKESKSDKDDDSDEDNKSSKDSDNKSNKSEKTPKPTKKPTKKPTNSDRSPSSSSSKSTKKPTRRPTRKPTRRPSPSSSDRRSTRRPTKRPTRKPTKKPTSSSNSRDGRDDCVDDESPRPVRSGYGRFRFNLMGSNAQCVDKNEDLYEWGQFDKIEEFSDCADACVRDVRSELLDSFRGYDWDCRDEKCRCLYDKGTLDSRNGGRFDRTNRNEYGKGKIEGTTKKTDYYCAKLAGTDFDVSGTDFDVAEDSRALRGYN